MINKFPLSFSFYPFIGLGKNPSKIWLIFGRFEDTKIPFWDYLTFSEGLYKRAESSIYGLLGQCRAKLNLSLTTVCNTQWVQIKYEVTLESIWEQEFSKYFFEVYKIINHLTSVRPLKWYYWNDLTKHQLSNKCQGKKIFPWTDYFQKK